MKLRRRRRRRRRRYVKKMKNGESSIENFLINEETDGAPCIAQRVLTIFFTF